MELVYWSVCSYSKTGRGLGKVGIVILARCVFHFILEHENLIQVIKYTMDKRNINKLPENLRNPCQNECF